jgi:hypothetical protein
LFTFSISRLVIAASSKQTLGLSKTRVAKKKIRAQMVRHQADHWKIKVKINKFLKNAHIKFRNLRETFYKHYATIEMNKNFYEKRQSLRWD